jgi:hypothetical protein
MELSEVCVISAELDGGEEVEGGGDGRGIHHHLGGFTSVDLAVVRFSPADARAGYAEEMRAALLGVFNVAREADADMHSGFGIRFPSQSQLQSIPGSDFMEWRDRLAPPRAGFGAGFVFIFGGYNKGVWGCIQGKDMVRGYGPCRRSFQSILTASPIPYATKTACICSTLCTPFAATPLRKG